MSDIEDIESDKALHGIGVIYRLIRKAREAMHQEFLDNSTEMSASDIQLAIFAFLIERNDSVPQLGITSNTHTFVYQVMQEEIYVIKVARLKSSIKCVD